jgi:hypothetical protein
MQERPKPHVEECLIYLDVSGIRDQSGINKNEAQIIIDKIKKILADQAARPIDQCNTLGVLSPFSAQTEYISKRLSVEISIQDIERHKILIGTPYSFQGEERDIVLISFCLDKDSHPSSFLYLNRNDVFNVSITRARNLQLIYGSFKTEDPKVKGILERYLGFIQTQKNMIFNSYDPTHDPFLEEVRSALSKRNWHCWPNFPVAGFNVDLVTEKQGIMCGIDLIGYPGDYSASFELERYRLFNRANLPIFPLSYYAWEDNMDFCLNNLEDWLLNKIKRNNSNAENIK